MFSLGLINKKNAFSQKDIFAWVLNPCKWAVLMPKLCAADDLSLNWNNQNQIEFIDGANDVFDDMADDIFTNYLLKNQSQNIHQNQFQNPNPDYSHFNLNINGYQPVFNDFAKANINNPFPSSLSSTETVSPLDDEFYKKPYESKKRSFSDEEYLPSNSDYKKIKMEDYQFDFNQTSSNLSSQLKMNNSLEQSRYESEFNDKFDKLEKNDKFKFESPSFNQPKTHKSSLPGLEEFHLENQVIKLSNSNTTRDHHDHHDHHHENNYLSQVNYRKLDNIEVTRSDSVSRPRKNSRTSSVTSDTTFDCPHCDASFKVKGYLTRHLKKHSTSKAFVCPFYQEHGILGTKCHPTGGFSRRDTFKTHLKALHFIYPPGTKSNERNSISGRCAGCFEFFENNFQWLIHHIEAKQCNGTVTAKQQDLSE